MSDNENMVVEKYGSWGSYDFTLWENTYQELIRKQKFDPDPARDEVEMRELKLKIQDTLIKCIKKRATAGKAFWISVLVALLGAVCIATINEMNTGMIEFGGVVMVVGIVAAVVIQRSWKKSIDKHIDAVIDFDKQYFDGEILFKRKKGIQL